MSEWDEIEPVIYRTNAAASAAYADGPPPQSIALRDALAGVIHGAIYGYPDGWSANSEDAADCVLLFLAKNGWMTQ